MNDDEHNEPQRKTVGRPFEKNDSRINKTGRPRSFDEFRKIAQAIADEPVIGPAGDTLSRAESILRSWAKSKVPQLQMAFIQYCYGAPPTKIETNTLQPGVTLRLHYAHELKDDGSFADDGPFANMPENVAREMRRRLKGPEAP